MILRIATTLPPIPGGLELHARELTLKQAELGLQIQLVFAEGDPISSRGVQNRRLEPFGSRIMGRALLRQRFALAVKRSFARGDEGTRIVHAHGDYAVAWAAATVAARLNCPSVLTIHGSLNEHALHRRLGGAIYRRLTRIIAVSAPIADQLADIGVPRDRIATISSGVHHARFAPNNAVRTSVRSALGIKADDVLVVAVGRLHPVKGFTHLIESARILGDRAPLVRIVIAGGGPEESQLRQQAMGLPNVSLVGEATHERVAELLSAADVFALSSVELGTQAEGTPTSVMEAMAAGLPIVATHTGGIPHLVAEGINGRLVRPASPPELAAAIEALAHTAQERRAIGERNRVAARERDWTVIAERVTNVYREAGWVSDDPGLRR